jgi:hypothetical protein
LPRRGSTAAAAELPRLPAPARATVERRIKASKVVEIVEAAVATLAASADAPSVAEPVIGPLEASCVKAI